MDLKLGEGQCTTIHLDGLDAAREEDLYQAAPKWVCSDSTILKITPDEDGCCCHIQAASPVLHGNATVTVTDRDNSATPALIFNITIQKKSVTSLGVHIDPVRGVDDEAPESPIKGKNTPLSPEGSIQKDPNTGQIRKNTDADTGDKGGVGKVSDVKIPGGSEADNPGEPFGPH